MKGGSSMKAAKAHSKVLKNNIYYSIIFFTLVLALWIGFLFAPQPDMVELPTANGVYDLADYNFENAVYHISNRAWQSITHQLYTPKDLQSGNITETFRSLGQTEAMNTSHATHIIKLALPPDAYYGISMMTAEYAMRIFIDDSEIDSVGVPGTTRANTEHRTLERTYYFSPKSETTTILVQTANFVHKEGSGAPNFIIGTTENIVERNNIALSVSFLIVGCLIATFLHHIGLFLLNRNRKIELIFAACCLLLALMNKKLFLMFVPDYTFAVGIRLEYAILFFTCALFVLFLEALHPKLMNRYITRGYYLISGLYLLTLILDIQIFTSVIVGFHIISVLMIGYIFGRLGMSLRAGKLENYLSFVGMLVLGSLTVNDILYHQNITIIPPINGHFFMTPIGMVFFVSCYSLAMSVRHAETEKAMLDAQENERQLANENATLDHMNILKEKLMSTISHEARTPLAILSSYAGLVAMELKDKGMDRQTTADLDTIAFEAKRVANLIDSMKNMTASNQQAMERIPIDLGELIKQTANLYMPILERSNITLKLQINQPISSIFSNPKINQPVPPTFGSPKINQPIPPTFDNPQMNQPVPPTFGSPQINQPVPPTFGNHQTEQPVPSTFDNLQPEQPVPPRFADPQTNQPVPPIFGNPAELTQVLFNLLQNAKNHTTSGSITISIISSSDLVTIYIEDTGVGIKPELLPDIFERGVKGGETGSGIGLAICKEIITTHDGTIQIESILEKGTKVTVTLPIYKEDYNKTQEHHPKREPK